MMGTWVKVGRFWILFITRVTASILFQLKDCGSGCIEGRNKIRVSGDVKFKSWGERGENDEQSASMNHVVSSHPSPWPVSESKSRWCKMLNDIETKIENTRYTNSKKKQSISLRPLPILYMRHPPTSPHSMCCARLPGTLLGYIWNFHHLPPRASSLCQTPWMQTRQDHHMVNQSSPYLSPC